MNLSRREGRNMHTKEKRRRVRCLQGSTCGVFPLKEARDAGEKEGKRPNKSINATLINMCTSRLFRFPNDGLADVFSGAVHNA
jgi:hypothetical protein